MNILDLCFRDVEGYTEFSRGGLSYAHREWLAIDPSVLLFTFEFKEEIYFGPAVRLQPGKMGKRNCSGTLVLWADVDRPQRPVPVLPPTAVISSGHGWHLYWRLDSFLSDQDVIETMNEALAKQIKGDSAHNIDRMLRLPLSRNKKDPDKPVPVLLDELVPGRAYTPEDVKAIISIGVKIQKKITTGDRRGYRSRSERDWAIIRALVSAGASDALITTIFESHKCGDKCRDPTTKESYLSFSINKARGLAVVTRKTGGSRITEKDGGYYIQLSKSSKQISTFVLHPTLLLEGDQDFLLCDVSAEGTSYTWRDVVFPRSSFTSVRSLSKVLTKASWGWLGSDAEVRALLPHLMRQLQDRDVPRAIATGVIGRHEVGKNSMPVFVTNAGTIARDGTVWSDTSDAPIIYVPTGREYPRVSFRGTDFSSTTARNIARLLPKMNEPGSIWPLIGWFMATPMKPVIEIAGHRFPILNVCGTRGSGKTTTILRVFQPLLGYDEPRSYDVSTTRFVTLCLLGSANASPIAFSEFRAITGEDFTRYVLLSYDTGHDARGRADQTTQDYPLIAPFSLDGEDKLDDPASLERMIVVTLSPHTIDEDSTAYNAYEKLSKLPLQSFALPYIMYTLNEDVKTLLDTSLVQVREAFKFRLPDRIRRNLVVCWAGVLSMASFLEGYGVRDFIPDIGAEVLRSALYNVYSIELGRAPVGADAFIELVVNDAAKGTDAFKWKLEGNVLWFHFTPSYNLFAYRQTRRKRGVLSSDAVRRQLRELIGEYMTKPEMKVLSNSKVLAYGIDLKTAQSAGLDIPASFDDRRITVHF